MKRSLFTGLIGCLLLVGGLVSTVHAQTSNVPRWEIQGGRSDSSGHTVAAWFVDRVGESRNLGQHFTWAPEALVGVLNGRPTAYARSVNPGVSDRVVLGAAGAQVRLNRDDWTQHLFFSFQVAAHTGRTEALSSVYEFVSTAGWTQGRWSVQVRHISNGGFQGANRGETMLLVGVAWPF